MTKVAEIKILIRLLDYLSFNRSVAELAKQNFLLTVGGSRIFSIIVGLFVTWNYLSFFKKKCFYVLFE